MLLKLGYSNKTNNPNASPSKRMFGLFSCGRSDGIRTHDLLVPNQAHYQAVPHPDIQFFGDSDPRPLRPEQFPKEIRAHTKLCHTPIFNSLGIRIRDLCVPNNFRRKYAHIPSCATPRNRPYYYSTGKRICQGFF